jgi:hypothetical protein
MVVHLNNLISQGGNMAVKETTEAVVGLLNLTIVIAGLLKDGPQWSDAVALVEKFTNDAEFKNSLVQAIDGISKVPDELKNLTVAEALEIVKVLVDKGPALVGALNK